MYRLRRLYLDSVGVADNRFSDLMVDCTDLAGRPTDTIVWLRNGAGKTTMLSLVLALILPDRRDFLATRTKNRTLEDLVLATDTAHVVAEWEDPAGHLLLTGAVYDWNGRVRPRDYNGAGKDRLRRAWWCLAPDPLVEGATLDDLPCTSRSSGRVDSEAFRAHIRALAASGVNAVVADQSIAEWHAALRERRFDPELFVYFAEVNATEGGIENLFAKIDSPGAFVRWLLRFVADRTRTAPVRALLADTATEIVKRPVYQAERDFCAEAQPRLDALGAAHARVVTAAGDRAALRAAASGFKRALLDAAEGAETQAEQAQASVEDLEAAVREARNAADASRRHRDEYLRIAAAFRVGDATAALHQAEERAEQVRVEEEAWEALERRRTLDATQAVLAARRRTLDHATADAAPLVEALDAAGARLAGALDDAVARADEALADQQRRLDDARRERDEGEDQRRQAGNRLALIDAEHATLAQTIARFDAARSALSAAGVVPAGEALDRAARRLVAEHDSAGADVGRLVAYLQALAAERRRALSDRDQARAAASEASVGAERLAEEVARLEARADRLGNSPRLRELLQAERVDLFADATDARRVLFEAVAAADAEILAARLEAADDRRAVDALSSDGLLPPRPTVEAVLAALDRAGVSAHPGWRYLAEHVAVEDHAAVIAASPDSCDGVVVYAEPAEAAAHLHGVEIDEAVVLVAAADFATGGRSRVVVGPSPARHDPRAASVELARRQDRLSASDGRIARLDGARRADGSLEVQIAALVDDLGPEGIGPLRRRAALAAAEAAAARQAEEAATAAVAHLEARRDVLDAELVEARSRHAERGDAVRRVEELLAVENDEANPARARLASLPERRRVDEEAEQAAVERIRRAEAALEAAKDHIRSLGSTRAGWVTRRAVLGSQTIPGAELEAAQASFDEADTALRERYPETELRRALSEAEAAVRAATAAWDRAGRAEQARALELAADPRSADATLRAEAAAEVRRDRAGADQAVGLAVAELREARTELASEERKDRRPAPLAPADREEALGLAADANQASMLHQQATSARERERDEAAAAAARHRARAGMLSDQVGALRNVEVADVAAGEVAADDDEVRATVAELAGDVDGADRDYASASTARSQRAEQLRAWAGEDRFRAAADDEHGQAVRRLRELFSTEGLSERISARAAELAEELATRQVAIAHQLEEVEAHKRNVVSRLVGLVDDALSVLGRASSLSELPAEIGPWGGQRFLVVEARQRPTREQISVRVAELVDRMVASGRIDPDPADLLWQATDASVAEGFRSSVLKPAPDQPAGRTPVQDMRKWSGGENLTASLLLFCVLAKLRAEQRSGTKADAVGGVVPLDNPLGKANYLPFLELQRRVARANGVQLVFWTGIGDLGAVGAFPRIAAMHKRPSAHRPGSAYVRADADGSYTAADDVAAAHLDVAQAVRVDD